MTIANFLLSIVKGKVRGHWPCLCGSGKIIRNCHKDAVEELHLVPTWVLTQSGCMIVDELKRRTNHFIDASDDVCKRQLRERSAGLPAGTPWTTEGEFDAITAYFQPPAADEGFNVIRHERA